MKFILHITPHLGGGIGTVLLGWMNKVKNDEDHTIICLDYINEKAKKELTRLNIRHKSSQNYAFISSMIMISDIVIVHWWDHPMLFKLFSKPIPPCRLVFWCHKHYPVSPEEVSYPDLFVDTSPVQGNSFHIWSTGGVEKYLNISRVQSSLERRRWWRFPQKEPWPFTIGYIGWVDYKKIHQNFVRLCQSVKIPDVKFIICGENNIGLPKYISQVIPPPDHKVPEWDPRFVFTGQVDNVADYLVLFEVFGYPLRPDHFGTCEQVLGEAMAAGVVPVVMDNPAERKIITDGVNGFLAKTEKEYVGCIEFLYRYPAIRSMMSFEARNRARELYSIDNMINDWNQIFLKLIEQPKLEGRNNVKLRTLQRPAIQQETSASPHGSECKTSDNAL